MAKQNNKHHSTGLTPNGRTRNFSLAAPEAATVQLVGDFTQWQQKPINMHKNPNGVWTAHVELPPGAHHYRFLVDGQWRDDPACARHAPNPYGSQNAVCEVV
jgi:1,4-alpha-glucan branching enzyme